MKFFEVNWTERHHIIIEASDEYQAMLHAIYLDDDEKSPSIKDVVIKELEPEVSE
jgi:hypothetical protein